MGRSRELTKGHRWKIFGMLVPLVFIFVAGQGVVSAVRGSASPANLITLAQIVDLVWNAVSTGFYAIFIVVAYHDLRVTKEGIDTDQIAAVFE